MPQAAGWRIISMGELKCDFRVVGAVQANCYFVYNTDTLECVIIDPGDEAQFLVSYIEKKSFKPVAILLTHGHFDHIGAVTMLRNKYGVKVYAASEERDTLESPDINLSLQMGTSLILEADEWLADGQEIELLGEKARCILTPGHTPGGMCFYFPKSGMLFSGDTLFEQSVGRTDFPGGSMKQIINSIREKLFVLPGYVKVYPGHGMATTIGDEKMLNPYAAI